jgi:DNA-binding NarL/FixJ family response regulator
MQRRPQPSEAERERSPTKPVRSSPRAEDRKRTQPVRVLLISDLLLIRAALRSLLEASAITVFEASTCEDAVPVARHERPDVTLLDLDLRPPGFAGFTDLASILDPNRIIALARRRRLHVRPPAVEPGTVGIVLKDESPDVLIAAIEKVHAGEVWPDRIQPAGDVRRVSERRRTGSDDVEGAKIATLTRREHEIIRLVGEGLKSKAIAHRLFISEATVHNHLTSILAKLGVSDSFELVVYAFKHGLVRHPDAPPGEPPGKPSP